MWSIWIQLNFSSFAKISLNSLRFNFFKPMDKGKCELTQQNLLTLIKNAPKLQILSYDGVSLMERFDKVINTNTFLILVDVLRRRAVKTHLRIILTKKLAPEGLLGMHKDLLTIEGMAPVYIRKHRKQVDIDDVEPPNKKMFSAV